jgi:hypothetical protein
MKSKPILRLTTALPFVVAALTLQTASADVVRVQAGLTTLNLDSGTVGALTGAGITATPFAPALFFTSPLGISFPIVTGVLDTATAKARIFHSGGVRLTNPAGITVVLSDFLVDTFNLSNTQIWANVSASPTPAGPYSYATIVNLIVTLPSGIGTIVPQNGTVVLPGIKVSLSQSAATALNVAFGTSLFTAGLPLGTANLVTAGAPAGQ